MATLFVCRDPRNRQVSCTIERWKDHILNGHPELQGTEAFVRLTIERPAEIRQSVTYSDRELYYRETALPPPAGTIYLRVVVAWTPSREGVVVSVYPVRKVDQRDALVWQQPTASK
jgi:hypothetical protein